MFFKIKSMEITMMLKTKITKILVPLDGSKNAHKGLETAIVLAKNCGATITGIYSLHVPSHTEFKGEGEVSDKHIAKINEVMDKAKELAAQNDIVFDSKILNGDAGYNIIDHTHGKDKYDMIVIGPRGRSATKEMFFGSVSKYVIHTSKIPVVVVN